MDTLRKKIKIVNIDDYYMKHRISTRECASNIRYVVNNLFKLIILIEKEINKFVIINTYLKMHIPMGMRRFFFNIANNGEFINNYCNYSHSKFHRFYHDWYLYNKKHCL